MKDEIAKVLEKLRTIGKNKSHSENDVREIKQRLEEVENILLKYLLVLPTSNNPRSSRAFTIVKIILTNGSSVMFIDLPGLEKKVDMIRDHYFPNDSKEQIQKAILDNALVK